MIKFSKEIMELALRKLPSANQVVILCSSGVDSIAASFFYHKKIKNKYGLHGLLHFNHKQRPQNDVMEASYCNYVEDDRHVMCGWPSANIGSLVKTNTEDGLRQARIDYIKNNIDNSIIITGHHLDDCVTGYLLNTLRGKEGYLPIPFISQVGTNLLVHPFLFTKKNDFVQYAEKNDLMKYVVNDTTNDEIRGSRRNFIRKDIVPLLEREKMGLDTIVRKKLQQRLMLEIIK